MAVDVEKIHKEAIANYHANLEYLKKNKKSLYDKIILFESALNTNIKKPKYELEYKDGYFDALIVDENKYFYNQNSEEYGKTLVENTLDFNAQKNSFKTFYDVKFTNETVEILKNASIYSNTHVSNAPIVHYVNSNLPEKQIMNTIPKLIIFGVGLGTHIPYIQMKVKPKIYMIIEPDLELFRLSLFTIKYANLAKMTKIVFAIGQNEQEFGLEYESFYNQGFIYNHYFKLFVFSKNCDSYMKFIQNKLVSQTHIMYSYDRYLNGIAKTIGYVKDEFNFLKLCKYEDSIFNQKPFLFLAPGPSLQRDIEFVKENKDKFVIVALYVTLHLLEESEIVPDIVVQYDEGGDIVYRVIESLDDVTFFDKTLFLFASHVDKRVMNTFPKENVFIFQAMFDIKKGFGAQTSPSVGELTYALLLRFGVEKLYMLGLDMAFDVETKKTHIEGHVSTESYKNRKSDNSIKEYSLRNNLVEVKGNFLDKVETNPVLRVSINSFNRMTKVLKKDSVEVYNLSNGAYFEDTIPLKIEDININELEVFSKEEIKNDIKELFDRFSDCAFSNEDKEHTALKVEDAHKIETLVNDFFKVKKDSNIASYEARLGVFIDALCFSQYKCHELQLILKNYIFHNCHYMYYLINMKGLKNPKRHMKYMNKYFSEKLNKIIQTYIELYTDIIEE